MPIIRTTTLRYINRFDAPAIEAWSCYSEDESIVGIQATDFIDFCKSYDIELTISTNPDFTIYTTSVFSEEQILIANLIFPVLMKVDDKPKSIKKSNSWFKRML